MTKRLRQTAILFLLSISIGIISNFVNGNGIPLIGDWPASGGSEAAVSPSAEENDPPFISLDEAAALFQTPGVLFIDARDPEDFELDRIKGAINVPYDYLPDDDYEGYWENLANEVPRDRIIVVYCSGTECELSLYLGRDMVHYGYRDVRIFYGGWNDWANAGLPKEQGE
ncbi:MAG: hypothetical protein DRP51_03380 [Candidatus Zixiibacteriota bacterium]|nr:MAG: hypothetical protein DRP51_03380 [candidate division Zixibacteria bacterium]HHI02023.1 rhodanese-like domain-containing protein [candidate division Zixibacteria bacterium]